MLSFPPAVRFDSLLPALTDWPCMGATQATTAFHFFGAIFTWGTAKNPFSKALGAESSWDRRKLSVALQQPSARLLSLQIIPSSSVVQWYLQMQLAENRGLTMLLLTFGLEKIADSGFEPEAFHLQRAASVLNPRLEICLIGY